MEQQDVYLICSKNNMTEFIAGEIESIMSYIEKMRTFGEDIYLVPLNNNFGDEDKIFNFLDSNKIMYEYYNDSDIEDEDDDGNVFVEEKDYISLQLSLSGRSAFVPMRYDNFFLFKNNSK